MLNYCQEPPAVLAVLTFLGLLASFVCLYPVASGAMEENSSGPFWSPQLWRRTNHYPGLQTTDT